MQMLLLFSSTSLFTIAVNTVPNLGFITFQVRLRSFFRISAGFKDLNSKHSVSTITQYHFAGAMHHIRFQISWLKNSGYDFYKIFKFMPLHHRGCFIRFTKVFLPISDLQLSQSFYLSTISFSDHKRTFVVKHRATCIEINFGEDNTAGSVHFHHILPATMQGMLP